MERKKVLDLIGEKIQEYTNEAERGTAINRMESFTKAEALKEIRKLINERL